MGFFRELLADHRGRLDDSAFLALAWFVVVVAVTLIETWRTGHAPSYMFEVTGLYSAATVGKAYFAYKAGGAVNDRTVADTQRQDDGDRSTSLGSQEAEGMDK